MYKRKEDGNYGRYLWINNNVKKLKNKKKGEQGFFFTQTTQTLYQYGIASSTVLLGTMLVSAARRARSRLHMGQEEILGVFNHVYLVNQKKKNGEFLNSALWWGK